MLLDQDAGRERVSRVVWPDRHSRLNDDGASVQFIGHQMDRGATYPHTVSNSLLLRIHTRERGQQRGMDVEDRVRERCKQSLADQSHETGEAHELDASGCQFAGDGGIERIAVGKRPVAEDERLYPGIPCARQSRSVFTIRDDYSDPDVQAAVSHGVDECLKIRSTTRNQDADARYGGGISVIPQRTGLLRHR